MTDVVRCSWCGKDPVYQAYHDHVWGRPVFDSRELFEKLCLDGQQAGLSWITILKKQANYQATFFNFDPTLMAKMTDQDVERLMQDKGIVRNRLKIESLIRNAKAFNDFEATQGSFSEFLWGFVGGKPKINHPKTMDEVPTQTPESEAMSKALKKHGFNFVGPTICYAFMQAVGMVDDHLSTCHVVTNNG